MSKKNVLILLPFEPYPLISGGHQGIFNGIAILKDLANVYVTFDTTESRWKHGYGREIEQKLPFVKVVPFITPESRHTFVWYWRVLLNKISSFLPVHSETQCEVVDINPIYGINGIREDKISFILKCVKILHVDIVQVDMIENIRIVEHLPYNVVKIFVHHELRFVRDELQSKSQGVLSEESLLKLRDNKTEEVRLLNLYDKVVTVSSIDTGKLLEAGVTCPILTSFSVVEGDALQDSLDVTSERKMISFVGPESHFPNYEGVMWFLHNCWDKLQSIDSGYCFLIIGKWSEETSSDICQSYKGVSFTGFVDDLSDVMLGTTLIVPLNIGSGIRMKILEAARMGIPVVSTKVGAEGLPLKNGEHAFITDNPDSFIDSILKLEDISLRNMFVKNMQKIILEKYSLEALKNNRKCLYE